MTLRGTALGAALFLLCSGTLQPLLGETISSQDSQLFTGTNYSGLKPGTSRIQINSIQNPALRQAAESMKEGTYDVARRVRTYEAYEPVDDLRKRLKTNAYSQFENPTGIFFAKGDQAVLFVENAGGEDVRLKIRDFGPDKSGEKTYELKNGLNIIDVDNKGLGYISYYTPKFETAPKVRINIMSGEVNGIFDASVHNNEDWKKLLDSAACEVVDMVGRHVHLVYPVAQLKEGCPENGVEIMQLYDYIINQQHEVMGLVKYGKQPKNRMFGRVAWGAFMFADGMGAGYGEGVIKGISNPDQLKNGSWGVAHEFGHVNQVRPGMKWVSTTEVTNNIFSIWTQYHLNPSYINLEDEECLDEEGKRISGGRMVGYLNSALVNGEQWLCQKGQDKMKDYQNGGDHFTKLCPLWQLQLYFAVAKRGNPDFYPDIFEIVRNTNEEGMSNGRLQLNFMKNACDVTKQNLTVFFESIGMLKPIDKDMDDYSRGQLTITEKDCDELKAYAAQYPAPDSPVIYYISSKSVDAFRDKLPVKGEYGKGITDNGDQTLTIEGDLWENATVFETWQGDKLLKIALVGTGFKDSSATIVRYPEGATRVEAVAWDGTRTLVHGKRSS